MALPGKTFWTLLVDHPVERNVLLLNGTFLDCSFHWNGPHKQDLYPRLQSRGCRLVAGHSARVFQDSSGQVNLWNDKLINKFLFLVWKYQCIYLPMKLFHGKCIFIFKNFVHRFNFYQQKMALIGFIA